MIRIRMVPSVASSLALGVRALAGEFPLADPRLAEGTETLVADLHSRLLSTSVDVARFWRRWTDLVLADHAAADAVEPALLAAGISELQAEATSGPIVRRIEELIATLEHRLPKLSQQLPLRLGPLRSQWDTYGPGLLRLVERQIWASDPPVDWWSSQVEVRMVHPILGGGGDLNGDGETLWMEALLADSPPAPPEVLRLAWLTLRLTTQRHLVGRSGITDLRTAWSLATVPLILDAGREIGLIDGSVTISDTMRHWQFGDTASAAAVDAWWQTRDPSTPMPLALRSLAV